MGADAGDRSVPPPPRTRRRLRPPALVRYAWAAPASAVGLLAAATALLLGGRARRVDGVLEVSGGRLAALVERLPPSARFSGITLGHVVLGVAPDVLARIRSHEHAHVRQYERWGVLFFPLYAGASVVAWLGGGRPYWNNHFERQARREALAAGAGNDRRVDARGEEVGRRRVS